MATIVVGGHARNVGKTSVVTALIASFPACSWTAVKISSHWHSVELPGNETDCSPCSILEETNATGSADTSRYLAAGARRSFWVRVKEDQWAEVGRQLMPLLRSDPFVIAEGNSVLQFLEPDLYILVLDFNIGDFKISARQSLARADAAVVSNYRPGTPWKDIPAEALANLNIFPTSHPGIIPPGLVTFVRNRLKI
jgi:hypothetical protein